MKKYICLVLAILLVAASLAVLYSGLMYKLFPDEAPAAMQKLDGLMEGESDAADGEAVPADGSAPEGKLARLGLDYFPLYPNVYDLFSKYTSSINEGNTEEMKGAGNDAVAIAKGEDFLTGLYSLIIIALLSIPVYMIFRLIPFNTLYAESDKAFLLSRPFARGLACIAATIVTTTATWFLYHSILYRLALAKLKEWANGLNGSEVVFNLTNIVIIVALVVAVIAILRKTIFRGSFLKSILMALGRTALFVIVFALANALIAYKGFSWQALVFVLAVLLVIGIADMLIEPPKAKEKASEKKK